MTKEIFELNKDKLLSAASNFKLESDDYDRKKLNAVKSYNQWKIEFHSFVSIALTSNLETLQELLLRYNIQFIENIEQRSFVQIGTDELITSAQYELTKGELLLALVQFIPDDEKHIVNVESSILADPENYDDSYPTFIEKLGARYTIQQLVSDSNPLFSVISDCLDHSVKVLRSRDFLKHIRTLYEIDKV